MTPGGWLHDGLLSRIHSRFDTRYIRYDSVSRSPNPQWVRNSFFKRLTHQAGCGALLVCGNNRGKAMIVDERNKAGGQRGELALKKEHSFERRLARSVRLISPKFGILDISMGFRVRCKCKHERVWFRGTRPKPRGVLADVTTNPNMGDGEARLKSVVSQ